MADPRMTRDFRRAVPGTKLGGPASPSPIVTGKIGAVSIDRTKASSPQPQAQTGAGDNRTQMYTYLTRLPRQTGQADIIYNGDRLWSKVTLTLENAGPVAVGQQSGLFPVLGGQGVLLETGKDYVVTVAKGTRLYIAANGVNRVKVKVEPLPWMEQITALIQSLLGKVPSL